VYAIQRPAKTIPHQIKMEPQAAKRAAMRWKLFLSKTPDERFIEA
jgi:hypothetical protein